jgi:uncharacterized protein YbbC (DUF1343 family)
MAVKLGIERLLREQPRLLKGTRVGAVVHPASVLSNLRHTADVLREELSTRLTALFGPQHGARGEKQDNMIESQHYRDPDTGVPVYSLYSETRKPTPEMMRDIDVLVYDLQDVGTRVYTFIYTLAFCMEACRDSGRKMIVADRPNPIGGRHVEGNLLDPNYRSFVGLYPLPMRHGMTVGELARFFNEEFGINCDLTVVPMQGWRRSKWFDGTGLPWVMPSPNMPTLDTAAVYPGMVLIEGTHLSEGRGTTRPFELVGAPYINSKELAGEMNRLALPGVTFRATYFEPTFHKWCGETCGGVQVHVTDREAFEPYLAGLCLIAEIRRLYGDRFAWRPPPYEYEYEKLPIEILCGGRRPVDFMETGAGPETMRGSWRSDVGRFLARRQKHLLYE